MKSQSVTTAAKWKKQSKDTTFPGLKGVHGGGELLFPPNWKWKYAATAETNLQPTEFQIKTQLPQTTFHSSPMWFDASIGAVGGFFEIKTNKKTNNLPSPR